MKVKMTVELETRFLTQEDCEWLIDCGHPFEDLKQIDRATAECNYKDFNPDLYGDQKEHRISRKKAIEKLGRETYLSGISRAAFHAGCEREYDSKSENQSQPYVDFDLSKWWK